MKHICYVAITLLLGVANPMTLHAQAISIGSEGASPPWNSIDAKGELVGFDIDVGRDICRRIKLECRFLAQDWDGIIPALTVGKFDAIMSGMAITEKRKKSIAFSQPYAGGFNQIVMRRDLKLPDTDVSQKLDLTEVTPGEQHLLDMLKTALSGRTLGVLRSSNSEIVLKELVGSSAVVRSYDSQDNLQLDLAAGRIDGGLADYFTWKVFLESDGGAESTFYGPELSGGPWGPGVGIGLRKADIDLQAKLDQAISDARTDGTLKRLSLQWFGLDVSPTH